MSEELKTEETPPVEAGQETPTETAPVETPPEGVEPKPTDEGKSGEPEDFKIPKKVQDKIDNRIKKETKKRGAAQREAEYQKGRADELEKQAKKALDKPVESPPKPKAEDFDDHEEFVDKLTDWKLDERDREKTRKKELLDETPTQVKRTPEQEVSRLKMIDKIEVSKELHDDFQEVVFEGDIPLTNEMLESMENSDQGAEILYHLGNNTDEAARISKLSPTAQAMAIGKLEGKISKTKTKKAPGAPEPITPINGNGASPSKAYKDMTMEEFALDRNKKAQG